MYIPNNSVLLTCKFCSIKIKLMPRKLLLYTFLILISSTISSALVFLYFRPYLRTNDVPHGPVVSVTKTITGKIVGNTGKTVTLENNGERLTIKSMPAMLFNDPRLYSVTPSTVKRDFPEGTNSAVILTPENFTRVSENVSDFSKLPVGKRAEIILNLNGEGVFTIKSYTYDPAQ